MKRASGTIAIGFKYASYTMAIVFGVTTAAVLGREIEI